MAHTATGQNEKTLVVLLGPTAVGKTELGIAVAKLLSCDVISADSRQIYKEITIGTAKPSEEDMQGVTHHLVDILPLEGYYSAAQYEQDALRLIEQQFSGGQYALMVGGSMMYLDAVTKGIDDMPTVNDDVRMMMKRRLEEEGLDALCDELRLMDPDYYGIVDRKNTQRIVHALEICYQTGRTYSSFRKNTVKQRPFRIVKIGLRRERSNLFSRINARVDRMMIDGLMDEARRVYPKRGLNSLNTVGYKELFKVIDGEWQLDMAVERLKKNTRVYAKKQMTWFAHDTDIQWIDVDKADAASQLRMVKDIIGVTCEVD